jgi:hypothetical protein
MMSSIRVSAEFDHIRNHNRKARFRGLHRLQPTATIATLLIKRTRT